jgi:hypothetical protein
MWAWQARNCSVALKKLWSRGLNAKAAALTLLWRDQDDGGLRISTSGIITTEWKVEGIDVVNLGTD